MYIRHLGENIEAKDELSDALYQAFEGGANVIRNARIYQYAAVNKAKKEYDIAKRRREELDSQVGANSALAGEAVKAYEQEIQQFGLLNQAEAVDQQYLDLLSSVAAEHRQKPREAQK